MPEAPPEARSSQAPAGGKAGSPRVLLCPAHYRYDPEAGSELSWAYAIADSVARALPGSVVVTGNPVAGLSVPYRLWRTTSAPLEAAMSRPVRLGLRWSALAAILLRVARFDVLHHVLPFAVDRTLTLAAHARPLRTAFVVGPIQTPLPISDDGRVRDPDAWRRSPAGRALATASARGLMSADAVVAVSRSAATLVCNRGVSPARVTVIPPGVDTDFWHPREDRRQGRGRLVTVGALIPRKRVDTVIKALPAVIAASPEASLTVVGDGPERAGLEQLSQRLGVADRVSFAGSLPRAGVADAYRDADAFVFGGDSESVGQVYLEALASGLPIVSVRNGGSEALIGPNIGVVVAADDARAFAAATIAVLSDEAHRHQLADNARRLAVNAHDWRRVILPRYLDVYRQAVAGRNTWRHGGSQ